MGFEGIGALISTIATSGAGEAAAGGIASAAVGAGINKLVNKTPSLSIPPPPGAAMVDSAGANAAAASRRRQSIAGGLQSTVGAGGNPATAAAVGANASTSGGKALLGS
jgi:hypothetical protein